MAFSAKGFMGIIFLNIFPIIGEWTYKQFGFNFKYCCYFYCIVNFISAGIFFVTFYIWKYSENTQEAVNRRKKLLDNKDGEEK